MRFLSRRLSRVVALSILPRVSIRLPEHGRLGRSLLTALVLAAVTACGARLAIASEPARGPLRLNPANPRYFTDGTGKAVYLTGSHTWTNFKDMGYTDPPPAFDYAAYLDFLDRHHHNFIRLWTWELTQFSYRSLRDKLTHVQPFPWHRTGPGDAMDGKLRFDLSSFDQSYFDRLRGRVVDAGKHGIYVSVMLFDGHALHGALPPWRWDAHPFNIYNNVNYVDGDPDGNGRGIEVQTLKVPAVVAFQRAYVKKVLDTLNDLDNVLYEIANESGAYSTDWQYYMIRFVHSYERHKPKQHPVGMTFQYSEPYNEVGNNKTLFDSPADWISPNPEGGYRDNPPVADGRKVIISDTDHLWGVGGDEVWVWKTFCRGENPIWMDPYVKNPVLGPPKLPANPEIVRSNMGYTRDYADRMDLAAATPSKELASTGYCLANPGKEYLVFAPDGGEFTVDLSAATGQFNVEWLNPRNGTHKAGKIVAAAAKRTFQPPFAGEAVLFLWKQH